MNNIKLQAALHASLLNLYARHPSLVETDYFKRWKERNQSGDWHEVFSEEDNTVTVIVQPAMDGTILCAVMDRESSTASEAIKLHRCDEIEVGAGKQAPSKKDVLDGLRRRVGLVQHRYAIRPEVDQSNGNLSLKWIVDRVVPARIDRYEISGGRGRLDVEFPFGDARPPRSAPPPAAAADVGDDLASNDLHHVELFAPMVKSLTERLASQEEKARRLYEEVVRRMAYDLTIDGILEFTWADILVKQLGWRGICDEFAVVLITLLRAAGIPARMKLLYWTQPDNRDAAHACVEWCDEKGEWHHADPTWKAFGRPEIYREMGAKDVTVMTATYPSDKRSNGSAWGLYDPSGDLRLHPYEDYILEPAFPGSREPGYSD